MACCCFLQALSATLLVFNRKFGLRTSGLQFLFWIFLWIAGIPQLRTQIRWRRERSESETVDHLAEYNFTSYIIFFSLSVAIWFVNCFADREPLQTKYPKSEVSNKSDCYRQSLMRKLDVFLSVESMSGDFRELPLAAVLHVVRSAGVERLSQPFGAQGSLGYERRRFVKGDHAHFLEVLEPLRGQSGRQRSVSRENQFCKLSVNNFCELRQRFG